MGTDKFLYPSPQSLSPVKYTKKKKYTFCVFFMGLADNSPDDLRKQFIQSIEQFSRRQSKRNLRCSNGIIEFIIKFYICKC